MKRLANVFPNARRLNAGLDGDRHPASGEDPYWSLKTLSRYAGLSVRTLRGYMTHAGHPLPHFRIGGRVLVRRSDFDRWAAAFRVTPAARMDAIVSDVLKGL